MPGTPEGHTGTLHDGARHEASPVKIAFLDDDPVVRIVRLVLQDAHDDPWIRRFFLPEEVDLSPLAHAARGLRASDGVQVTLAAQADDVRDATIAIFRRGAITRAWLDANPGLALVQRLGERPEGIDVEAVHAHGAWISCLPRRTLAYTAEHAILLMLALAKRLLDADRAVRAGLHDATRVQPIDDVAYNWPGMGGVGGLCGRTLGLVGLGEVGVLVAKLARAFGMDVLYHKRRRATVEEEAAWGCTYVPLAELLQRADFVSLHAANLPENERMVNAATFAAMRPDAFFVNTSRGRLVDEDALYEALRHGTIAGAGLDVHRVEPRPADDRFARLPNVILTPHVAGGARSGLVQEFAHVLGNCRRAARGEPPLHGVLTRS